jgi:hypothetical protein
MPEPYDDGTQSAGTDLTRFARPGDPAGVQASDVIAISLSLIWVVMIAAFVLFSGDLGGGGALRMVMLVAAAVLPLALIWVAAVTARQARAMREEARRLQSMLDALRQSYLAQAQGAAVRPSVERKLDEIAAAQRQTESVIATFASRRDPATTVASADRTAVFTVAPPDAVVTDEQPTLALGTPTEDNGTPVSVADFIKALDFPATAEDREGFKALRRGLADRSLSKLIRAAQDVLTLLSQDGIYMDDLRPDRSRPEIWRRFAQGERGRAVAGLGGIRDRTSLALATGRMRQDTIFRDAAHHFLRQFDRTLSEFEKYASDQELAELAETRSARAFMLLGRVMGTFD